MKTAINFIPLLSLILTIFLHGCGGSNGPADRLSTVESLSDTASFIKEDKVMKGNITGTVDARLFSYMQCSGNKAIYIFQGHNTYPDDIDKNDPNPVQSADVVYDSISGRYRYSAYSLSEGEYTLALTCLAESDSPLQDDDINFSSMKNVTVSGGSDTIAHLFM